MGPGSGDKPGDAHMASCRVICSYKKDHYGEESGNPIKGGVIEEAGLFSLEQRSHAILKYHLFNHPTIIPGMSDTAIYRNTHDLEFIPCRGKYRSLWQCLLQMESGLPGGGGIQGEFRRMCRKELLQEIGRGGWWAWERGFLGKGSSRCQGFMGSEHSVLCGMGAECEGAGTGSERASDVMPREPWKLFK